MSDDPQAKAKAIVQEAQQLIDTARRGSYVLEDTLRSYGLDPAKVRAFCERDLPPEGERMLAEQLAQDQEDIERQRSEAPAAPAANASNRPRGPLDLF
jgi:hypothetical protein